MRHFHLLYPKQARLNLRYGQRRPPINLTSSYSHLDRHRGEGNVSLQIGNREVTIVRSMSRQFLRDGSAQTSSIAGLTSDRDKSDRLPGLHFGWLTFGDG
jgi:hypothetical protein